MRRKHSYSSHALEKSSIQESFDHEAYEKALDIILDNASKEYKLTAIERPVYQMNILRTYLWLSSLLVASEISAYKYLIDGDGKTLCFSARPCFAFYYFAFYTLLFAVVCFCLGVDSMRGRKPKVMPFGDLTKWSDKAYEEAKGMYALVKIQTSAISAFNDAIVHHNKIAITLGYKLRTMSILLIASLCMCIMSVLVFVFSCQK